MECNLRGDFVNKIINCFEELSMKNKIIILLCILVFLIVSTTLYKRNEDNINNVYTSKLEYKSLTVQTLLEEYTESYYDRNSYYAIKQIINSMESEYDIDKNNYKKYFDAIDSNYSKNISKRTFSNKLYSLFEKVNSYNNEYKIRMYRENTFSNTFIIEIYNEDVTIGHIGFVLYEDNNIYSIFYIETL